MQAQRAEVDSRLLLEELQGLMQAKADVAQQRADLDRANALLMAERELLCEQLDGEQHVTCGHVAVVHGGLCSSTLLSVACSLHMMPVLKVNSQLAVYTGVGVVSTGPYTSLIMCRTRPRNVPAYVCSVA